jgi:hypothetical protein
VFLQIRFFRFVSSYLFVHILLDEIFVSLDSFLQIHLIRFVLSNLFVYIWLLRLHCSDLFLQIHDQILCKFMFVVWSGGLAHVPFAIVC